MSSDTPKLVSIGKEVYIFQPSAVGARTDPSIILIFGWLDAKLPHLQKYVQKYADLFPGATVLIICCPLEFWFSGQRTREAALEPVVDFLKAQGCFTGSQVSQLPRILVHSFSNVGSRWILAGCNTQFIIDSSPGGGRSLTNLITVFTAQIRSIPLRLVTSVAVTLYYCFARFSAAVLHRPHPLDAVVAQLLKPETDALVPVADIKEHIRIARDGKLNVTSEEYQDSPHVAHARTDPLRYWAAVQRLWNSALELMNSAKIA
ncbi:hypothetical protein C8J56DRAFT_1046789 [Mycena floridula]|nr:hypothetical protein C8J56DRAFT_1046789 [Mycena floridula]